MGIFYNLLFLIHISNHFADFFKEVFEDILNFQCSISYFCKLVNEVINSFYS